MRNLIIGIIVGSTLTASLGVAAQFYNSKGEPAAPRGSIQSYDYYRSRQLFIDQHHLREGIDALRANPCGR